MERKNLAVCIPGLSFSHMWMNNFISLINMMQARFNVEFFTGYSNNIYATRNHLLESLFSSKLELDLVLWLDDDNPLSPEGFNLLVEDLEDHPELDGIMAWYWLQAHGFRVEPTVSAGLLDEPVTRCLPILPSYMFEPPNVVGVEYGGMGSFLVKFDAIKKVGLKGFVPQIIPESSLGFSGDDVAWFIRAKDKGLKFGVDKRILVPHYKTIDAGFDLRHFIPQEIHRAMDIEGWMQPIELKWLYETAKQMDSIVEIGSWKGRSSYALASGTKGKLYCVDTWKGSTNPQEKDFFKEADSTNNNIILDQFLANIRELPNINVHVGSSKYISRSFSNADMIFIDGDHSYEMVMEDLKNWVPKAKKLICGHDYNFPSVRQALKDFGLEVEEVAGTIWASWISVENSADRFVKDSANESEQLVLSL